MGAWGNIRPSTQMSAQRKLTPTWMLFFGRADLRLPLSGRQMSSLSLSVSTFHQLPSTSSQKNSATCLPLTLSFQARFRWPQTIWFGRYQDDSPWCCYRVATSIEKFLKGSQTWDSKPPHRREVDRWGARTQKELPRESLATSLVKCWKTTRECEKHECWAKSLRSAQAAWQKEGHVASQVIMQNGSSTHIVSCVSIELICICPSQCSVSIYYRHDCKHLQV